MTLLSKCRKTPPLSSDSIEAAKNLEFSNLLWSNPRDTFYPQDNKGEKLHNSTYINIHKRMTIYVTLVLFYKIFSSICLSTYFLYM